MLNVVGLTIPSGYVCAESADPTSVCVPVVNSLRNEILGLVLIVACIAGSTKSQFEYLNLKSNNGDEFASLRRAYKGEEGVSTQEIKKELISAIEIMQSKLDVNDRLTYVLSNARLALTDKANDKHYILKPSSCYIG